MMIHPGLEEVKIEMFWGSIHIVVCSIKWQFSEKAAHGENEDGSTPWKWQGEF